MLSRALHPNHGVMTKQILFHGSLYAFGVWAIGCIVIILVVQLLRRFWKKQFCTSYLAVGSLPLERCTTNDLLEEALEDLLKKYEKKGME